MNRLPAEIETEIWNMSGYYRDMFQPTLQKIRMKRLLCELRSVTDCAHTCYRSKGCTWYTHFSEKYQMISYGNDCCDWGDYYRKIRGWAY